MRSLALSVALVACTPTSEDPETGPDRNGPSDAAAPAAAPIVLTWPAPAGGASHAMGAEGTLERDGPCLYLRTPDHRFLLVFPEGASWDAEAGAVRLASQLLREGSRIAVSGDSRSGAAWVAPGFDAAGCDASRVFRVAPWLVR